MIRTYSELISIPTFKERFEYLKLNGLVGEDTFGYDRYLNQMFYKHSKQWKHVRNEIILRDTLGGEYCLDLATPGRIIPDGVKVIIHHMNPLTPDDFINDTEYLLNPDFLIATTIDTHNAIHYGNYEQLVDVPIVRTKNDTCPWRK